MPSAYRQLSPGLRPLVVFGVRHLACGAPLKGGAAMAARPAGQVRVLVEPDAGAQAILTVLAGARASLWMEMYLLTDGDAMDVLIARRAAGCDVRVVLEPHPYQADGANDAAFARLTAAGVTVSWASPRFAYTHAKFAVIDHTRLLVLTLNLTRSGLGGNREYAVVDDAPADVAAADAVLDADLTGEAAPVSSSRVLASPGGTRPALLAAVRGARRALAVEMEEVSDASLVRELAAAASRGVGVTVVAPASGRSTATSAALARLATVGATVRLLDVPQVHAKVVVADDWVYLGSANLTLGSLDANREFGLGLADAMARRVVAATIAADAAFGQPP
jgi:cardiolipin synthase